MNYSIYRSNKGYYGADKGTSSKSCRNCAKTLVKCSVRFYLKNTFPCEFRSATANFFPVSQGLEDGWCFFYWQQNEEIAV